MKISKSTKSLFWLNFMATLQIVLGGFLFFITLILLIFGELLISLASLGLCIFFAIRGKIARLEYERKSGYIVYGN